MGTKRHKGNMAGGKEDRRTIIKLDVRMGGQEKKDGKT